MKEQIKAKEDKELLNQQQRKSQNDRRQRVFEREKARRLQMWKSEQQEVWNEKRRSEQKIEVVTQFIEAEEKRQRELERTRQRYMAEAKQDRTKRQAEEQLLSYTQIDRILVEEETPPISSPTQKKSQTKRTCVFV